MDEKHDDNTLGDRMFDLVNVVLMTAHSAHNPRTRWELVLPWSKMEVVYSFLNCHVMI